MKVNISKIKNESLGLKNKKETKEIVRFFSVRKGN